MAVGTSDCTGTVLTLFCLTIGIVFEFYRLYLSYFNDQKYPWRNNAHLSRRSVHTQKNRLDRTVCHNLFVSAANKVIPVRLIHHATFQHVDFREDARPLE